MKVYQGLLLSVGLMYCSNVIHATSLSTESQNEIAISALKGGLTVSAIYTAGYALFNDFKLPILSEHKKIYAILGALGAITLGIFRYNFVPERYYESADYELEKISHNTLILLALTVRDKEFIDQVKLLFVRESFPLVCAFNHMNELYSHLQKIDESLDEVLNSSRLDLQSECCQMQIVVQTMQNALELGLKTIKEEPQFMNEFNAQTSLAMQQVQMALAQAAQSQATAAWVHALKD